MVASNSIVKVDYTAWAAGRVFDTTIEKVAKENSIYLEGARYKPVAIALGKHHVILGFEEELQKAEVGKQVKVEITAEKAYGQRNPELVRLIPLQQFQRQGIEPVPGMPLDLDGTPAKVQSVSGGRVRVDFNHELAGLAITYEFTISTEAKTPAEKVAAVAEGHFENAKTSFDSTSGGVNVEVSASDCISRDYLQRKGRFLSMLLSFVDEVKIVKITEEYNKEKKNS